MSSTLACQQTEALYLDHHNWLYQWLYIKLNDRADAADLAHDTYLRLIVRHDNLADIDEPRAYLTTIAKGLVANHWRRCDIEQAYLEALKARPIDHAISPEQQHLIIERLWRIDQILQGLPAKVRQAFLLSRLDGMKYAEIALVLKVSERMVKKYMAQAMLHCLRAEQELSD